MSAKSYVVLGEAPESDSEGEIDVASTRIKENVKLNRGKVIGGEAPESDDESNGDGGSVESVSSAVSASSVPSLVGDKPSKKNSSLLVKKLRERNVSLQKNVKEFVSHTIVSAANELNSTNQQLLKCQVQLQEAADIFKTIKSSITHLDNNLDSLLCTPFLPYITIRDNNVKESNSPLA